MFKKILLGATAGSVGIYASALAYVKSTQGECTSQRDLKGQTIIVTGGNTGIGLETAKDLAARNARVILACRDLSKGEEAAKEIAESTGNPEIVAKQVDISSFQSVRDFAKDIIKTEKRLDVLINNAGIFCKPTPEKNEDGLDMIMATNHYGPFLLTNLLLPLLKESAPSRIVVVSSGVHNKAKLNLENPNEDKACKRNNPYFRSKLANVLFTRELSEKLKDTNVTVNAINPGFVKTRQYEKIKEKCPAGLSVVFEPFLKTPKEGAQTSIHVAVAEELEGVSGKYFSECKEKELKGNALDANAATQLWEHSEKVTKLNENVK